MDSITLAQINKKLQYKDYYKDRLDTLTIKFNEVLQELELRDLIVNKQSERITNLISIQEEKDIEITLIKDNFNKDIKRAKRDYFLYGTVSGIIISIILILL